MFKVLNPVKIEGKFVYDVVGMRLVAGDEGTKRLEQFFV